MILLECIFLALSILLCGTAVLILKKWNPSGKSAELQESFRRIETLCSDEFQRNRKELNDNFSAGRQENLDIQARFQETSDRKFGEIREMLETRIREIREQNSEKLEEMRKTVDEKLQTSVEKHFNESFRLIGERLELVQKGLGEMRSLAEGVGDLKKVLTNVKTRGNIGEIQLGTILEQYLSSGQYLTNVVTVPDSKELVEFAIKMPGKTDAQPVLLPIDSKFPVEDYQRLTEGYDVYAKLSPELKRIQAAFEASVKKCAKMIHDKYVYPPQTTDFALMFVPSEGIYAEILRSPGLLEQVQNESHVSIVGPSNLVAFLNSLQMGFRTLAIEKRSMEVWNVLSAVKTEFRKFGDEMEATRKSLQAVVNHVDNIGTRSRAIERKLKNVQELSGENTEKLLSEEDLL